MIFSVLGQFRTTKPMEQVSQEAKFSIYLCTFRLRVVPVDLWRFLAYFGDFLSKYLQKSPKIGFFG